jgi:hypothetical protein
MGNLPTGLPLYEAQKSEAQERDGRGNAGMPGVDPRKMGRLRQYIETGRVGEGHRLNRLFFFGSGVNNQEKE